MIPIEAKIFFSLLKYPDRLWSLLSRLFSGCRDHLNPGHNGRYVELTTRPNLIPMLRLSETVTSLTFMPSSHILGQLYLIIIIIIIIVVVVVVVVVLIIITQ